jgi:metal-dependent amidase/aminoacylase/carboxypeptidase family protein
MFSRNKQTQRAIEALQAEVASLRVDLYQQVELLLIEKEMARAIADRLVSLDTRVSSMGSELSRQFQELGGEIEQLAKEVQNSGVNEIVDTIKASQTRLANEQARYEITFRQDLAALADKLLRRN